MQPHDRTDVTVVCATRPDRHDLERLIMQIKPEDRPEDAKTASRVPQGIARSPDRFDTLSSDSAWFLIARLENQAVGLSVCTRVPKLDDRTGFLYLDEIHDLSGHRRQGIGTALMHSVARLAETLGFAGIRLLTEASNRTAQALYDSLGGRRTETLLYQIPVVRRDSSL